MHGDNHKIIAKMDHWSRCFFFRIFCTKQPIKSLTWRLSTVINFQ